jgi:hypothetical protein
MNDKPVITQQDSPHVIEYMRGYNQGVYDERTRFILLLNRLRKGIVEGIDEVSNMVSKGEEQ